MGAQGKKHVVLLQEWSTRNAGSRSRGMAGKGWIELSVGSRAETVTDLVKAVGSPCLTPAGYKALLHCLRIYGHAQADRQIGRHGGNAKFGQKPDETSIFYFAVDGRMDQGAVLGWDGLCAAVQASAGETIPVAAERAGAETADAAGIPVADGGLSIVQKKAFEAGKPGTVW